MPWSPCLDCGALVKSRSRCRQCELHAEQGTSRQTQDRGGGQAAKVFRQAVLARAGNRCEWEPLGGERCEVTDIDELQAHHRTPLIDGGSNDPVENGRCLCRHHHHRVEVAARVIMDRAKAASEQAI